MLSTAVAVAGPAGGGGAEPGCHDAMMPAEGCQPSS